MLPLFKTLLSALLVIVYVSGCGLAQPESTQVSQPAGVIFENVRIFNGTSDRLSEPSNVLVVGNIIKEISSAPIADPPGTPLIRIQGDGRTLMPGLIDNHVHIFISASSLQDLLNPSVSAETLQARATEEAAQMLLRGFTTVRDMGGPMLSTRAAIDQGEAPGPRIYPSGERLKPGSNVLSMGNYWTRKRYN